jgi:hypothetical protein
MQIGWKKYNRFKEWVCVQWRWQWQEFGELGECSGFYEKGRRLLWSQSWKLLCADYAVWEGEELSWKAREGAGACWCATSECGSVVAESFPRVSPEQEVGGSVGGFEPEGSIQIGVSDAVRDSCLIEFCFLF